MNTDVLQWCLAMGSLVVMAVIVCAVITYIRWLYKDDNISYD